MTVGEPAVSNAPAPSRRTNLDRIAAILLAFDAQNTPLTSRALVACAGASQATGFGLIRALARANLLERVDHGLFRLGAQAAGFAFAPLAWPAARQSAGTALAAPAAPAADRSSLEQDWSDRLVRTIDCSGLKRPPPYRIAFANASLSNPWRLALLQSLQYGARINAAAIAALEVRTADDDWERQLDDVERLLEAEPDALIVSAAPGETGALSARLRAVMAAGIPVVAVDRRARDENACHSFVTASDRLIGQIGARWLIEKLGGRGRIWMLSGTQGASPAIRRQSAALEQFATAPGITVEAVTHTGWTAPGGERAILDLMASFGTPPDGVWCDSGLQGVGSLQAFEALGLKPPAHTGGDLNRMYKMALHARVAFAAVDYPAAMGALAIEAVLAILRGETVMLRVEAPMQIVLPRGQETRSVKADKWAERHVRWDLPDDAILSQGAALRKPGTAAVSGR